MELGFERIYSDFLADEAGNTSSQVRKDFSLFGIRGKRHQGYDVRTTLNSINALLGDKREQKIIIVGAGNLGMALAHYKNFNKEAISVVACFDSDPFKFKPEDSIPVLPIADMISFIQKKNITVGIIAVPAHCAQEVCEMMVLAGIQGVLNFSPLTLKVSAQRCYVVNFNVIEALESVFYFINQKYTNTSKVDS